MLVRVFAGWRGRGPQVNGVVTWLLAPSYMERVATPEEMTLRCRHFASIPDQVAIFEVGAPLVSAV